jgi:hypothetical protein
MMPGDAPRRRPKRTDGGRYAEFAPRNPAAGAPVDEAPHSGALVVHAAGY